MYASIGICRDKVSMVDILIVVVYFIDALLNLFVKFVSIHSLKLIFENQKRKNGNEQ